MAYHRDIRPHTSFMHLAVAGAAAMFFSSLLVCLLLPFLLPFTFVVPFVMVAMAWSLTSEEKLQRQAQKLASARCPDSRLQIIEVGRETMRGHVLVLNDWGAVGVAPGQAPRQWAWSDIQTVEETLPGRLRIGDFTLHPWRFFLISEVLQEKLKGKVVLDFDPVTGESHLLKRLGGGRVFSGLKLDEQGLSIGGRSIAWDALSSVVEKEVVDDENLPFLRLYLTGGGHTLELDGDHEAYQLLKATLAERWGGQFVRPPHDARERARLEFEWLEEIGRAAFSVGRKARSYSHLLRSYFAAMLVLAERYHLEGPLVKKFYKHYATVLAHDGQTTESERLLALAG